MTLALVKMTKHWAAQIVIVFMSTHKLVSAPSHTRQQARPEPKTGNENNKPSGNSECRLDPSLLYRKTAQCWSPGRSFKEQKAQKAAAGKTQDLTSNSLKAVGVTGNLNSPGNLDSSLFIAQISPKVFSTLDKRRKLATFKNILPLSHSNTSSLLKYLGVIS